MASGLERATRSQVLCTLVFGAVLGLLHSWLLGVQHLPLLVMLPQLAGTIMLWIFMYMTLAKLFMNARVFSRLGASLSLATLLARIRHRYDEQVAFCALWRDQTHGFQGA